MGKKAAISLPEHKNHDPMDVVEMNELYTFVKKTLKTRIWIAVDRNKSRICAFVVGPEKRKSLRKLIDNIDANNLKIVCTDGNFAYEEELGMNADIKHVVSKSETRLVLRYYLARLHCKTKCSSKSILMLTLFIKLLLAYGYGLSCSHEMVSNPELWRDHSE